MDFHNLEWKIEDILVAHREWITKLYVEDKKTEAEIVQELCGERKLKVTVSQIKKCIRDWKLVQPSSSGLEEFLTSASYMTSCNGEGQNSASSSTPRTLANINYDDLFTNVTIPSPPQVGLTSNGYLSNNHTPDTTPPKPQATASPKDRLKVTCHHGPKDSECHETEFTLAELPKGPSHLQIYAKTDENHEMVAVGLESSRSEIEYRRAGNRARSKGRVMRGHKLRVRVREVEKDDMEKAKRRRMESSEGAEEMKKKGSEGSGGRE